MSERQIDELNAYVKTYLAPSEIEGVGVFALRDLDKGEKLHADMVPKLYNLSYANVRSKLFPEVKELLLKQWPLIVKGSHFAYPTTRIVAYMNHSDKPNYNAQNDTLIKDVKKGEEITEDYRKIDVNTKMFPFIKDVG
jgi:SET domain-containing protein